MNRPADSFSLSLNTQSTHPNHAGLQAVNASQIHREKTDFACLGGQVNKTFNHAHLVTAVTDSYSFTLLMCSYSASFVFEFAAGSSSGEIQVDSRPSLNRANFPGRSPHNKKLYVRPNGSQKTGPHRCHKDKYVRAISRSYRNAQTQKELNDLKTATSAV